MPNQYCRPICMLNCSKTPNYAVKCHYEGNNSKASRETSDIDVSWAIVERLRTTVLEQKKQISRDAELGVSAKKARVKA